MIASSDLVVTIDSRCTACGACLATCPERALLPAPRRPLVVAARCTGCLACVEVCPRDAVSPVEPDGSSRLGTVPASSGGNGAQSPGARLWA